MAIIGAHFWIYMGLVLPSGECNQGTSVSQCFDAVFNCPSSSISSDGGFLDFNTSSVVTSSSLVASGKTYSERSFVESSKSQSFSVLMCEHNWSCSLSRGGDRSASGLRAVVQLGKHINLLEMRTEFLHFQAVISGQSFWLQLCHSPEIILSMRRVPCS